MNIATNTATNTTPTTDGVLETIRELASYNRGCNLSPRGAHLLAAYIEQSQRQQAEMLAQLKRASGLLRESYTKLYRIDYPDTDERGNYTPEDRAELRERISYFHALLGGEGDV